MEALFLILPRDGKGQKRPPFDTFLSGIFRKD
jgi:hypothetical protein